jgi:hypothetical protein
LNATRSKQTLKSGTTIQSKRDRKMSDRKPNKQSAWDFARQCHLDAGGDMEKAKQLVRERAPREFGSIWVSIIIAIAFQLLKLWWNNRTVDPGSTPTSDLDDDTFNSMDAQCDVTKL